MNIVITSGGTSEYIDKVRKITNIGTGRLGKIIAEEISNNKNNYIFYICSKNAFKPEKNLVNIEIIEIETTLELKNKIEIILTNYKIDYFIHSMAVSDYMIDYVTTSKLLSENISKNTDILNSIVNNNKILDNNNKISSIEEDLILRLIKTPKIIETIKKLSPKTQLIGFKLLENVTDNDLINTAKNLMLKNKCDYVVANDLLNVNENYHKAFIINKFNEIDICYTKKEIAQYINKKIKNT